MAPYDILGNIALVKFTKGSSKKDKLTFAKSIMTTHNHVSTVLEKSDRLKGRLRIPGVRHVLGRKTTEALYKENGCVFRFDVANCYFSPRLSSERAQLASLVKKNESVLVLFGGVGPFAVVIAKTGKPEKVVSVELGKIPSKYAEMNVKSNKVKVEVIQGDVKRILPKIKDKFDRIVMARPNLKDDFLESAFPRAKKGGMIHYYGFYDEDKVNELRELIEQRAKESGRKIKIVGIKKAGDIGVREYRYRADIKLIS